MAEYHERKQHGSPMFPYTVYRVRLPEWIPGFPLHWHDEAELICVKEGTVIVNIQSHDYQLNEGDIAFVQPQFIHSIRQYQTERAEYYNILFRFSLLEENYRELCYEKYLFPIYSAQRITPQYIPSNTLLNQTLTPFVDSLLRIHNEKQPDCELLIKSQLYSVMHYIYHSASPEDLKEQQLSTLYNRLKKALELVESAYQEEITVERAAAECSFSASHFSKMFRKLTGHSFTQYLKGYRLEMAAKKMSDEGMNVSTAALESGFNNLSYFSRAFRERYQVTPIEYRIGKRV